MFLADSDSIDFMIVLPTSNDGCILTTDAQQPEKYRKKGIIVLKVSNEPLTEENIMKDIIVLEMTKNIFDHLYTVYNECLSPILQNPLNQAGWSDLVTKDLMEKLNQFIAQTYVAMGLTKGKTMLPLPPTRLLKSDQSISDKDKAHIFEGCIILWTKQIKNILRMEPEQKLKQGNNPGPLEELEFWGHKSENLNSIYDQLQSEDIISILRFLEHSKSTYTSPFSKLQRDVKAARMEANDNLHFLKTLKNQFEELCDTGKDFMLLHELFIPIMHKILLIWKHSRYYNTPPRLVVIIREICNEIVTKASDFINGPMIFSLITNEETYEACEKLQTSIDVCTKFKDAYFEYKAKAEGGWKLTTNALFVRLDSYLERCHDILHLTNTIMQFNKLAKIELGGTKGKALTETVNTIYAEFKESVDNFQAVKYDIMNIEEKEFDDDFYHFRSKIKELERRLAAVITQSFDDSDTITGRFKLLDSFEGLLSRPIIQDELEKKHIALLDMYKTDLKTVQSIFLEGKALVDNQDEKSPIFVNMPPVSGALVWCQGLRDRISEPYEKLPSLGSVIMEREEFNDVKKLYESITKSIQNYEQAKILEWKKDVVSSSEEKLQQPLLIKDEAGLLKVNFDPALIRLLRDVKYFLLLSEEVPPSAATVFEQDEIYREQICSLDLIVNNYNYIKTSLLHVEEPLIRERIDLMDKALMKGFSELKWICKFSDINDFIARVRVIVEDTREVVNKMKESIEKVRKCLDSLNTKMFDRKSRPMGPDDYDQNQKAYFTNKVSIIKESSQQIGRLLKEIFDAIKIDKKSPYWMSYTEYVNEIILDGIIKAIITAVNHLNEQITPAYIKRHPELHPLFEIRLELNGEEVMFDPIIEESATHPSVRNTIRNWINDFFQVSNLLNRLDTTEASDFLQEVRDSFELKQVLSAVFFNLDEIERDTKAFKEKFNIYGYLWESDPTASFEQFLTDNEPKDEIEDPDEKVDSKKPNPLLAGAREKIPSLDLFDDKITELKAIQTEISKISTPVDISWLKINLQPLKAALNTKVTSWIKVYTDFLLKQFKQTLKNMKKFIKDTNDGILVNPADQENQENIVLLMKVMKVISDFKDVEPKVEGLVKRMKEMVNKLKKHNVVMTEKGEEEPLQSIDNGFANFNEQTQKVFKIKADILPLQTRESNNIKSRLVGFSKDVVNFRKECLNTLPFNYSESSSIMGINDSYKLLDDYYKKMGVIETAAKDYNNLERLFELEKSDYKELRECNTDLRSLKVMWDAISMVNYQYNDWMSKPWRQIKADTLLEQNKQIVSQLKKLPREVKSMKGYNTVVEKVKNMGTVLPLISSLHSEFMEKRHWNDIMEITGTKFDPYSPTFTFEDIIGLRLHKFENEVNDTVEIAEKQSKIEKKLKNIEQAWAKQIFEFEDYNETKLFQPLDAMMETLDANSMDLMGMKSQGKYVEFFIDVVEEWREKLSRVDSVVNEWLKVQKNWRILVNIFMNSEDIKSQLPEDTKVFEGVDKEFRELMAYVSENPIVVEACTPENAERLITMSANIKRCEKALNDYLEQKKKSFPRFYFLSNQSLLTILSNGNNPPKVCEFLGDCFDGLKYISFGPASAGEFPKIGKGLISKDNEHIPFAHDFVCEGAVESWLSQLEFKMRNTLYDSLEVARGTAEGWELGEKPREEWVRDYPAQIALLTTQIVWTEDVTRAFEDLAGGSESAMKDCENLIRARIKKLIDKVREDLDFLERCKIINIITIDVHSRDVVEKFNITKVQEPESFAWLSQLKFYWDNKDTDMGTRQALRFPWEKDKKRFKCIIKIVDWFRFYSYEYVGNSIRLVVTPLTDRCYITLTQALNLTLGGAPAGPAGTGKTETTKDLGRAIGLPVMVFNCSDQMNKDSMAQIFMGLSQSGAWGCFDEFNRISIEVLSVISTQVKCVLDNLKEKKTRFIFMEEGELQLVDTVGFFITMNPGYSGRTELPENLKALFRSCAMVVPEIVLICENMLMSEGFEYARDLSKKFLTLYVLSSELLSKQKHYDWGLRAVKSVLRQAGMLKRSNTTIPEDNLLMRALRDFNLPKIVTDDQPIFLRLIDDLFPKIVCESKSDPNFWKLVMDTAKNDMGLVPEKIFVKKVVELAEIFEVRHCCFLIGSPGCGKTAVWTTLAQTHTNNGSDCEYDTLNPKAVTSDELFGAYTKTKEWKNGVVSMILKNQSKNEERYKPHHKQKWSILDGDIDPEWIESLNTVMDDNKVLTLVSNDRIPLTPEMRLLFEISNLKNATPATVSRAGVLFINDSDIGWMPFMNSWLDRTKVRKGEMSFGGIKPPPTIDEVAKSVFYRCFQSYIEQNTDIHRVKHVAPVVDIMMIMTLCTILDALLLEFAEDIKKLKEDEARVTYEAMFVFAGMWAFGGSVGGSQDDEKDQKEFNSIWRIVSKVKFPEGANLCYDYFWEPSKNSFSNWSTRVSEYEGTEQTVFNKIYVSTVHTTRLRYMLDTHISRAKPVLFIGSAGTGKTAVIKDFLASTESEKVQHRTMNFNSFTDSKSLQVSIESMIEKKSGRTFGSATNKILAFFIDDLNMPYVDVYGTQSPIALMRQITDYSQIFNREQLEEKKFIQDMLFLSCLNPKSGSFVVDLRMQRHFSTFTMFTPSSDTIKTIFGSILGKYLEPFEASVQKLAPKIIDGTIGLFKRILMNPVFAPSATKFHYQFNLRDLAKVTEGVMQCTVNGMRNGPAFLRLWIHECKKVFEDRMINEYDVNLFRDYLKDAHIKCAGEDSLEEIWKDPIIFTTFISIHQGYERSYASTDYKELKKVLEDKLTEYNETKAVMNLVLFNDAMDHVCRIVRILDMPGGNALLVGVGGSGKQSLSRLSAFILGYDLEPLVVTQTFGMNDLKNLLQELYKKLSKPGANSRVFMVTDSQIKDEAFLIPINDMLSAGWIADLFPKEDVDGLVMNLRNEAKGAGCVDNLEALTEYYLDKMKKNLHLILCFSPVGENFRVKSRKFPGIINSTSIDWFFSWPKQALVDVADRFLADIELPSSELHAAIALNMAEVHTSIDVANEKFKKLERRHNYTTPKSYLELISFYKKTLDEQRKLIGNNIKRFVSGVKILEETRGKVQGLEKDLREMMIEVNKRREKTNALIEEVGSESAIVEHEQRLANEEEERTNVAASEADKLKSVAEAALKVALPALEKAKDAVNCLKKPSITEMKSLGTPPSQVIDVAAAVMILFGEKVNLNDPEDKIWKKAQNVMNNPTKFIESVQNFKGETIDQAILDQLSKILGDPNFNEDSMLKKNYAASKLCSWVCNIVGYNKIFKEVKPLDEAKNKAVEELETKERELAIVKERVRVLNEKVTNLKKALLEAEIEKQEVEAEANACQAKLWSAERLVNGLAGEHKRWGENVKTLGKLKDLIIGDVLLASAFVSYIGAFSAKFRIDLWQTKWYPDIQGKKIPISEGVTPLTILTNEATMASWKNNGLPADQMSLENAAIITSCERWPLLIDPQLQGSGWIRLSFGENLNVISLNQNRWLQNLITSIQMGKFVLIEGIQEEIDATLEPLLQRAVIKKGKNYILELGGDPIDYDPKFKLFLMTKLVNPHFRPEIAAQCTLINFIVTESGLEEQLLASVVNIEKNELEQAKQELVKMQNEFEVRLHELEEKLLQALSEADPATILDNTELIQNLDTTKTTAKEIEEQQIQAKQTEIEINDQREFYRPVAAEGSMLYFLIISLNVIDHMYQYSLDSYYTFFYKGIEKTKTEGENRVADMRLIIRFQIYQWVARGLFERHILIFLSMLTFRLMQKKVIDVAYEPAQMDFLIKCVPRPGTENTLDWLPNLAWDSVQALTQLEEFKSFGTNLEKDTPLRFKDWYNEMAPEDQKLPLDWKKLENMPFQKLLVLRCMRPDRITIALTNFIKTVLPDGEAFVEMDQKLSFTEILESAYEDSKSSTPIFFILSPGADPVKEVEKIGKKRKFEQGKSLFIIALGQGQDEIAKRRIEEGGKDGHWVMLQNIHLMPKWLIELEKILDSLANETSGNANFRLFLSAEPSKGVPIGILDRSIKLTNEPPSGLKANMKRAWTYFSKDEIEERDPKVKSIFFGLCYFHSTVIERRRFGPKGWNMFYPFNIGDLRDSYLVLNKYIESNQGGRVPFEDLIYIFGEIMYGGHIVDDWDRKLCIAYLDNIMTEAIFDEEELFPFVDGKNISFRVPPPSTYEKYIEHIESTLMAETPMAYGLHPNAEIGFRTNQCNILFSTLMELQPREQSASEEGAIKSKNDIANDMIKFILEDLNLRSCLFNLEEIKTKIDEDSKGPYQNVFIQELEYMNNLMKEIIRSLDELDQGLRGLLTVSEKMEQLIDSIEINRVPPSWTVLAYPSKRGLTSWLQNLMKRIEQLNLFRDDPLNIPKVVHISRFFNPQSFLTAIKQLIGRIKGEELNKLYIQTEITKKTIEEIDTTAKEGAYVFGFILEGARWDMQIGVLEESRPKEMFCSMPVVYCRAQKVPAEGKEDKSLYYCPVYKTEDRGNTYVFTAQLKTKVIPRKWILAGVAMLLDVEGVGEEVKKK